eukprot:NODE_37_length_31305_cov_0.348939.p9 type:complete len:274 gc:universal NODE_37_length_31305_cov_0.348939:16804-17625(+)
MAQNLSSSEKDLHAYKEIGKSKRLARNSHSKLTFPVKFNHKKVSLKKLSVLDKKGKTAERPQPQWKHFSKLHGNPKIIGDKEKWICKHCNSELVHRSSSICYHIHYGCKSLPVGAREEFLIAFNKSPIQSRENKSRVATAPRKIAEKFMNVVHERADKSFNKSSISRDTSKLTRSCEPRPATTISRETPISKNSKPLQTEEIYGCANDIIDTNALAKIQFIAPKSYTFITNQQELQISIIQAMKSAELQSAFQQLIKTSVRDALLPLLDNKSV